ncbi:hypothetical protein D9M68_956560 [compost metagenome]
MAPAVQLFDAHWQVQGVPALQLRQAQAIAVVDHRGAQWRVVIQALQQGLGGARRTQRLLAQGGAGDQSAEGVQGLGGDALLGDPVGRADEGQVGHQQHGGQQ